MASFLKYREQPPANHTSNPDSAAPEADLFSAPISVQASDELYTAAAAPHPRAETPAAPEIVAPVPPIVQGAAETAVALSPLEKARAARVANRDAGERAAPISNPMIRNLRNPTRTNAIRAMCAHCMGCTATSIEEGFRANIRECASTGCPLHGWRPFQSNEQVSDVAADGGEGHDDAVAA